MFITQHSKTMQEGIKFDAALTYAALLSKERRIAIEPEILQLCPK
jgi:hypothetical protein